MTTDEYYEATVEVAGREPHFWYTVKCPHPDQSPSNLGNLSFEEYAWYTVLFVLNNSNEDLTDRYVKRETLSVDLVRVTKTKERVL